MVAFFRQLCAAPLKIVLFLLRIFQQSNVPLVRWIWLIGGETEYANLLITTVAAKDLVAARREAKTLLEKTKDAQLSATMAIYEFYVARNAENAHRWIADAEALNCKHSEHLLLAKLFLCDHIDGYDTERIAGEIISRNDLPMQYTGRAYIELAEKHIARQQWERAEDILDRVLSIEANQGALGLKWITELFRGNTEKANAFLSTYKKMTPAPHAVIFEAAGHYYLNNIEQAKACLHRAINDYAVPKDHILFVKKQLGQLLESECAGAGD